MKETHNTVKHLPSGEDVFERVISNIELLNDQAPEINIVIRVNLTHENKHEYPQLCSLYVERFKGRKNIGIAPAFVLDRASNCDKCEIKSTLFNHKERSEFILDLAYRGFNSPLSVIRNLFSTNVQFATIWRSHSIRKDMPINVGR